MPTRPYLLELRADAPTPVAARVRVARVLPWDVNAFRLERIELDVPERWLVHDVRIGGRSQLRAGGDPPNLACYPGIAATEVMTAIQDGTFETIQRRMEVEVVASALSDDAGTLRVVLHGRATPGSLRDRALDDDVVDAIRSKRGGDPCC